MKRRRAEKLQAKISQLTMENDFLAKVLDHQSEPGERESRTKPSSLTPILRTLQRYSCLKDCRYYRARAPCKALNLNAKNIEKLIVRYLH